VANSLDDDYVMLMMVGDDLVDVSSSFLMRRGSLSQAISNLVQRVRVVFRLVSPSCVPRRSDDDKVTKI